jgi:hypothetical protein
MKALKLEETAGYGKEILLVLNEAMNDAGKYVLNGADM